MDTNFISIHPCIFAEYSIFSGRVYTTAVCYFFFFNMFCIYTTNIPVLLSKEFSTLDQIFMSLQVISKQIKVLFNTLFLFSPISSLYLSLPPTFRASGWRLSLAPGLWQCDRGGDAFLCRNSALAILLTQGRFLCGQVATTEIHY